jgi:hypothetical protein
MTNLVGQFGISPGHCAANGAPSGSYLEIEVGGTGIPTAASSCTDNGGIFTPVSQGGQGLVTGHFQPDPMPTFDAVGNSNASAIIQPVRFLANTLGLSTTCANQATEPTANGDCGPGKTGFPVPSLSAVAPGQPGCASTATTDCLVGDLSSLGATWAGFPIKTNASNPLSILTSPLAMGSATCINSSGCDSVGIATGSSSKSTCVSDADPGDCALFGTFNSATGAYTLVISTGIDLGLLPNAALQLVLRGTYTSLPNGILPSLSGASGKSGKGGKSSSTTSGQGSGVSTSGGGSSGPSSSSSPTDGQLNGTLTLGPSQCANSTPTGSYFTISFNPVTEGNTSSSCDGGAYTLLQPGTSGLAIGNFNPDPSPTFDAKGNSLANSIITPVPFNGHALGLGTSPEDVQDAPQGPALFSPPEALVDGTNLAVDLRSLNLTYDGTPNDTCAQSFGVGCWLEGSRVATGTYNPSTGNFTLDWYSSQDFSGGSGEVDFNLSGHFTGTVGPANPSLALDLQQSTYSINGIDTESDSYLAQADAPSPTAPTTTVPVHEKITHAPPVVSAFKPIPHGRPTSSWFPWFMVGAGGIAALTLLWIGRRSRQTSDEATEEQT